MNPTFWRGRRVFLTGHTGFKGGWLSLWLAEMGAEVTGYALAPSTDPCLFEKGGVKSCVAHGQFADLRDLETLGAAMRKCNPEVVIHMAAQPLVRESYVRPLETYATNVMGTANLLECARQAPEARAIVVITTDKCYENRGWAWGYREIDRLGGHDPYSNSKACAELVVDCYRQSFFKTVRNGPALASARAGNVVGGGDWSADRLVPDIVRGCLGERGEVRLRNPDATRPWQHVLEPLGGYLELAEKLASGVLGFDEGWNFGPDANGECTVLEVAEALVANLGKGKLVIERDPNAPHEAARLQLDCSKARSKLGWRPKLGFADTIKMTAAWYAAWNRGEDMQAFTLAQIRDYTALGAQ